MSQSFR